ncbi:hypothetical protein COOFOMLJ_02737 [Aeromonas veronii]
MEHRINDKGSHLKSKKIIQTLSRINTSPAIEMKAAL